MTHSPLTTSIRLSVYNGNSRQGRRPERLIIHHMASTDFAGSVDFMTRKNNRDSCSTYAIGQGQLVCMIDEDFRPSSTGWQNDLNSITVEVRNTSGDPTWPVEASSLETIAQLAADLSKRYGWGTLRKGTNIRWHKEFNSTRCPGEFILANMDNIVNRANQILGQGGGTPAPQPGPGSTYTVVKGDTLSGIGTKTGVAWKSIASANGIASPYIIRPGQKLTIPGGSAPAPAPAPAPSQDLTAVARAVIRGDYGNGNDRTSRLRAAGYDPSAVQARVNELLGGGGAPAPQDLTAVARAVIRGDYGNGADRRRRLSAAGYDPDAVQRRVNEIL